MSTVGVSMVYYLCLRASEYGSNTKIPDPESHQFDSKSVELKYFTDSNLVPSSSMHAICWTSVEIVQFTIKHAKNIRRGHGVAIEDNPDATAFLQLVYLWSRMSTRLPDCSIVPTRAPSVGSSTVFGFHPKWFKPHSIRMVAPTVFRAAGGDDGDILNLGRWKQVPTSLIYQGTSTKNNNRLLRAVSSPTLFTAADINLTRLLSRVKGQHQQPTVRRF